MLRNTPPALPGLPLLGNLLEYRRDHVEVFRRGYRTLGPVFSLRLGPQRAVVLVGPERHRFFFTQVDRTLSLPEVYRFVIPMFGPVLNAARERETRRRQLSLLHSAFKGAQMEGHVRVMAEETARWLDGLGDGGTIELNESLAALGMNIAASSFMGREIRARVGEFRPLYHDLARGMEFVLPPNLPLPRFRRRDAARRRLEAMIRPVLAERRAHPERHSDFLQVLAGGSYPEAPAGGEDATIAGLALMTVFTAYITTAAQAAWSLVQLLADRGYLERVREEVDRVLPDGADSVTPEALARLEHLEWALRETQRMHPVMSHYARYTAREYEIDGFRVPRGWFTMVSPAVAHRLPEVFADPDRYDPLRFAPGRAEDSRPFALIGFGAGLYKCPGMGFGTHEMKCIVALLIHRFRVDLLDPDPGRDFELGVIRPRPPCRVRCSRRAAAPAAGARAGAPAALGAKRP